MHAQATDIAHNYGTRSTSARPLTKGDMFRLSDKLIALASSEGIAIDAIALQTSLLTATRMDDGKTLKRRADVTERLQEMDA